MTLGGQNPVVNHTVDGRYHITICFSCIFLNLNYQVKNHHSDLLLHGARDVLFCLHGAKGLLIALFFSFFLLILFLLSTHIFTRVLSGHSSWFLINCR